MIGVVKLKEEEFLSAFIRPLNEPLTHNTFFAYATRPAAVLICLFEVNKQLHVLFTQRAEHLKHHAGQISFPGGKAEDFDKDLFATATREAQEEIGLDPNKVKIVGSLDVYNTISGFAVQPIVAIYEAPLKIPESLVIDTNEVSTVFDVPLSYLMNKKHYHIEFVDRKEGRFPVYFIPYKDKLIWGATAGMLAQLQSHIQSHSSD